MTVAEADRTVSGRAFTRAIERGRANAEQHYPALVATYERLIRRFGRRAAATLQAVTAASDWQPPPEGALFPDDALTDVAALNAAHRKVVQAVATPTLERFGIAWDIAAPLAQDLLENAAQRTGQRLGDAVQPVLRASVAEAYEQGLSVLEASELIRERIVDASRWQAEMLARTDLNGLANGASVAAAKLAKVQTKVWLTAADERVRESHVQANGQQVPVDQPFQVGGELLSFPGDPVGSDEQTANCRCTVVYEIPAKRPVAVVTAAAKEDTMPETEAPTTVAWMSDLAFEGAATGDGRYMLPEAITWRELPIPLMAMTETGPGGHEGAFLAGKITRIERDDKLDMDGEPLPDGVVAIRGHGVFDIGGDNGSEIARLVSDEFVRGVSIDPGAVEAVLRDPDTGDTFAPRDVTPELMERVVFGEMQTAFVNYEIAGATVCPTPAFADARIAVIASGRQVERLWAPLALGETVEPLTAAAAGLAPVKPPADWFAKPEALEPTPLTFTRDGQVFGHVALWSSCHTGKPGRCFTPPRSPSGYSLFHLGEVECDDGQRIACGQITFHGNHAPLTMNPQRTRDHYANSALAGADVRAVDGNLGIWVCGAVRPNLTAEDARALCAAKPSGDWRPSNYGALELMGILAVNIPGYPVPRTEARLVASAAHPEGEVVALIASGLVEDPDFERKLDVLAARAEGGIDALAALAEG